MLIYIQLIIGNTSDTVVLLNRTENFGSHEFTSQQLDFLREQFVYEFNESDYVSEILEPSSMVQMDFGFDLPFFGARYNRANVSRLKQ